MFSEKFLEDTFDLIIDFKDTNFEKKYVKFPLWLCFYDFYNYKKHHNLLDYLQNKYEKNLNKEKSKFATLVSKHDREGQRTQIINELEKYGQIYYGGLFKNNIGYLVDNKNSFISDSVYNVCPENSSSEGYCTEKIFQAFEGGTIPIYWGYDQPEKNIINSNKYCFCNLEENLKMNQQIRDVIFNKDKYVKGPLFTNKAPVFITKYYNDLIISLKKIIDKVLTQ